MRRDRGEAPPQTGACVGRMRIWYFMRAWAFLLTLPPRLMSRCILSSLQRTTMPSRVSAAVPSPPSSMTDPRTPMPSLLRPNASTLRITSVTSQVRAGATAAVTARTLPGADCQIAVTYRSGRSRAKGLVRKIADASGEISWTWRVGTKATHGDWPMDIISEFHGESQSMRSYVTVQ